MILLQLCARRIQVSPGKGVVYMMLTYWVPEKPICPLQALIALKLDTVINGHMDVYHSCVCAFSFMCVPYADSDGTFFLKYDILSTCTF